MIFSEASNTQAYLKAGFMGFAGSGKTFTATRLAIGLHRMMAERGLPGGTAPVNFIDTETGSDWVEPVFRESGIKLFTAKTRAFVDLVPAIRETERSKGILIIDSITHFWRELTESYAKKKKRTHGLVFSDWAWLKGTWGEFTDAFINSHCHIVMCGRAGYEYDFFTGEDGKRELEKTGIKMKAEAETGYEPSILVLMEREQELGDAVKVVRTATVLKDRARILDGKRFVNPSFNDFKPHVDFLNLGGKQLGVDTTRTSLADIESPDFSRENDRREREIVLDEVKELLLKHHPGSSATEKKAKGDLMELHCGTRSWERFSTYTLAEMKESKAKLKFELEPEEPPGGEATMSLNEAIADAQRNSASLNPF